MSVDDDATKKRIEKKKLHTEELIILYRILQRKKKKSISFDFIEKVLFIYEKENFRAIFLKQINKSWFNASYLIIFDA